jgi:hypothetical protein
MKIVKIIAAILALAGVVVFVRFLMRPDDEAIVRRAQRMLAEARSLRYDVLIQLTGELKNIGDAVEGAVTTDADLSNPAGGASNSTFRFTVVDKNGERRLAGESRKKDGLHYLKLGEGTALAEAEVAEKLKDRWMRTARPLWRWMFPSTDAVVETAPTQEGLASMRAAVGNVALFTEISPLPPEEFEGATMRRYLVTVNQDAVIALLLKWREVSTRQETTEQDYIAAAANAASWGVPQGELWIDKKTGHARKIILKTALASNIGVADVGIEATFSRYGEPVKVEAPDPAEDLADFLETALEGRLRLAGDRNFIAKAAETKPAEEKKALTAPAPDAAASDSDSDGLDDGQEHFYSTDVWNPDSDGDGFTDGHEVKNGMNPAGPGALFSFGLGD